MEGAQNATIRSSREDLKLCYFEIWQKIFTVILTNV